MSHDSGKNVEGGRGTPGNYKDSYVFDFERRKKAAVLLHEQGQGAPCLKCGQNCNGGFSLHYWRKVCTNCRCSREEHDIPPEEDPGLRKIGKLFDTEPKAKIPLLTCQAKGTQGEETQKPKFEWIPPGVSAELVEKYMLHLPKESRPLAGSVGADDRRKRLEVQLPSHDYDPGACNGLDETEAQKLQEYIKEVKRFVVGQANVEELTGNVLPLTCYGCRCKFNDGEVAVRADKVGADKLWHPHCFRCEKCKELLVDLIYFHKGDTLYCGRHYAETTLPRCSSCDELIFAKEYTQAEDQFWHLKHFCCWNCDQPLANKKYVPWDGKPHCLGCYEMLFAKVCVTCACKIEAAASRISFGENHYHADDKCFRCCNCQVPLMDKKFVSKSPYIFCSPECKLKFPTPKPK